jgi:hypothetical protein
MATAMPFDCIYCGEPAASFEHIFPAAVGGRDERQGIICGHCNSIFGRTTDVALSEDMKPINAILGVREGRSGQPITTVANDPSTGRTYVLSESRKLQHPEPLVLSATTNADGGKTFDTLASTQKQSDDFIHSLRMEGKALSKARREVAPLLFAREPFVSWSFGGTETFRAVARLVLNVLAVHSPLVARGNWLSELKRFVRAGGSADPWVYFSYLADSPAGRVFEPRHRVVIFFDSLRGAVTAHVSLFGLIQLAVRLGQTAVAQDESWSYEIDPLAKRDDPRPLTRKETGFLIPPELPLTQNPSPFTERGLVEIQRYRSDMLWTDDALSLLAEVNAARDLPPLERRDTVSKVIKTQGQRLLNIAVFVAHDLRKAITADFGQADGNALGDALDRLVQPDSQRRSGVTLLTELNVKRLCDAVTDRIIATISSEPITESGLRDLLEGGPGASVVARVMFSAVKPTIPFADEER